MQVIEQSFHVVLFIMLYKVVSIFEFPVCNIEVKAIEQSFYVEPFVLLILSV